MASRAKTKATVLKVEQGYVDRLEAALVRLMTHTFSEDNVLRAPGLKDAGDQARQVLADVKRHKLATGRGPA